MDKKDDFLEKLKDKKDILYHSVRTRDKILYAKASAEWIATIREAYGILKDIKVFHHYSKTRNKLKKISKENGHSTPWYS